MLEQYSVVSESPKEINLEKYNDIYVGWLDLGEDKWEELGYETKEEWVKAIELFNIDETSGMQTMFRRGNHWTLMGKNITGAKSTNDGFPSSGQLYVKFKNAQISSRQRISLSKIEKKVDLTVDVEYYDIGSKEKIYEASLSLDSKDTPNDLDVGVGLSFADFRAVLSRVGYWVSKSVADKF